MHKAIPNHGNEWTAKEEGALADLFDQGFKLPDLVDYHGRTPGAILGRLEKIGKLVNVGGRYYRTDALWHDYRDA